MTVLSFAPRAEPNLRQYLARGRSWQRWAADWSAWDRAQPHRLNVRDDALALFYRKEAAAAERS